MFDQASQFVRSLRRELKMTQEELAHELGISLATVNRWENGRSRPSKLARAALLDFAQRHGHSSLHHKSRAQQLEPMRPVDLCNYAAIFDGVTSLSPSVAAKPSDISS